MNAFWEAGHVVTNSPIARMERKPDNDLSGTVDIDFRDAASGGAEFFVLGFLEYQVQGGRPVPVGIVLKIYRTGNRQLVYEQRFPAGTGRTLPDEFQLAQETGRAMIPHLSAR